MPLQPKTVNRDTFNALHIAQATINYTRNCLKYGSSNQIDDLKKLRQELSPANGQSLRRVNAIREGAKSILLKPHAKSDGLTDELFQQGILAGVAAYYRAGNCGEHANIAFCYLTHFGFPGLTITYCSSKLMDHAFVLLSGHFDSVVCDPWPGNAQACLWDDHFCKGNYEAVATHTITDKNMGYDPLVESFKAIDPDVVATLPLGNQIKGYSPDQIEHFIKKYAGHGLYNHLYTTKTQEYQDYHYKNDRNQIEKLSEVLHEKEEWSAKLLKIIDDVGNKVHLDQQLKFL
jgi:hypothetical protein